jgi:hypothetical protein
LANRSLAASRCAALISRLPMFGFLPNRNRYKGQFESPHALTSATDPQEHSRHFALIDFNAVEARSGAFVLAAVS